MYSTSGYDPSEAPDHNLFMRANAGDEKLSVHFYNHYIPDDEKSVEEGRPIYRDWPFCRIHTPGDRNNIIDQPVNESYKQRFPQQWARFKAGEDGVIGTRLEQWPLITKALVEELRYFGFRTVEHIAEAKDDVLSKMPGLRALSEKAKVYLDAAKGNAPLTRMQKELETRDADILGLKDQLQQALERLNSLEKAKK